MSSHKNTKPSEQMIVAIGFALIILVAAITFLRTIDFKKTPPTNPQTTENKNAEKYPTISTTDLQKKMLKEKSQSLLLDIRSENAFIEEHALDSLNIPLANLESSTDLSKEKQIFLLGENSQDEAIFKAAEILTKKGLTKVTILAGGMESWKNLGGQTVTSGDPSLFVNQAKVRFIEAENLKDSLENNKLMIIDARPQADYLQGHIKNAINIPFEELEKRRSEIGTLKTLVVYDVNDTQGFQSAARIYDLVGIPAYDLRGGFINWQSKGFEVVK